MRQLFIIAILSLGACADNGATAQTVQAPSATATSPNTAANWTVDHSKSNLSFEADQGGENFTGTFGNFDAQISFYADDLSASHVSVDIDLKSADAGDAERTDALPGKDWFYVEKFPIATFETVSFTHKEGDKYEAKANLTIRGATKPVTLPFSLKIKNKHASMQGSLVLNRRDFNVGTGSWENEDWAGHMVTVNITLEADMLSDK